MADVTVYMKSAAASTGKQHEHQAVRIVVHERHLRVSYIKTALAVCYPFDSIEKWQER